MLIRHNENKQLKHLLYESVSSISPEDMETVIAFAWNKHKGLSDKNNIEFISDAYIKENKIQSLVEYYYDNKNIINTIIKVIPNNCSLLRKLSTHECETTDTWYELGEFDSKPNCQPKTDLISDDGKYHISVKKFGGSQILAAHENEAKATLKFAALNCSNYTKHIVNSLFIKKWSSYVDMDETRSKVIARNHNKKLTSILQSLINNDNKFKLNAMIEALTGRCKFGKKSNATANCVLLWDLDGNSKFYSTPESYLKTQDYKFNIRFKNHDHRIFTTLRIEK